MTILTVAETGSTNADMLVLARQGAGEGDWLRADRQTAGRGRQGRVWTAPAGNLSASTIVRLRADDPPAATLTLVAAVALHEAIGVFGVAARIKWPNDLIVEGGKLSGILLERSGDAVVVGIGVNLVHHPDLPDRLATSLAAQRATVTPEAFLDVLADGFARVLHRWRSDGIGVIRSAWLAAAHPVGTPLAVRSPNGDTDHGLFDGLDADGALVLRLASGARHVIHAADVFVLKD